MSLDDEFLGNTFELYVAVLAAMPVTVTINQLCDKFFSGEWQKFVDSLWSMQATAISNRDTKRVAYLAACINHVEKRL